MAESICACCGEDLPDNPTTCPHCDEVPPEVEFYTKGLWCNEYCRDRNAKKHQPRCHQRTQLRSFLRATHLLQDLFFVFREASFSRPVTSVSFIDHLQTPGDSTNDALSFRQAGFNDIAPIRTNSPVYRLPECLKGNSEKAKQHRQSILAFLSCSGSLAWMYKLTRWMLLDSQIASEIGEIKMIPRQDVIVAPLAVRMAVANETIDNTVNFSHEFCQVKLLPDGDPKTHYVLDLSGAQYGWHDPIFPFDRYIEETAAIKEDNDPDDSTEEDSPDDDDDDDDDDDSTEDLLKETTSGKQIQCRRHGFNYKFWREVVKKDMRANTRDTATSKFGFKASETFYTGIKDLFQKNKVADLGKWFESPEELFQNERGVVLDCAKGIAVDAARRHESAWAVEIDRLG